MPGKRNASVIYEWKLRPGAKEIILNKISSMCISMKTEDYLELPDRLDIVKKYELSAKAKKLYEKMERECILSFDEDTIDAVNAAALTTKLMQICSGAVYNSESSVTWLHNEKLEVLDQMIEEAEGENVIIFYGYRHERDRILERYSEAVDIKEDGAIQRWKEGKIKILLAHPASAGHGLNLQSGGHISIWFSLPTSLELYQQAIKRLHRQGQADVVRNYILLAKETFEEDVYYRILQSKEERQNSILEVLKAKIEELKQ
jgi:SNF2 family DNA or RNA helicase